MSGGHDPIHPITQNERQIFDYLLRPDDSYDSNGVYWADMPLSKRVHFVSSYDAKEANRELSSIGKMMKKDPLSPVGAYFRNMVIPGAGLGLEGYVLFSIGNIKPLLAASGAFTSCWGKNASDCDKNWVAAVEYLEIVGIMIGQVLVGFLGELPCLMVLDGTDCTGQVIGWAEDGVSYKIPPSCSSVCSCSLRHGA